MCAEMTTNVTLKLDSALLRQVKVLAAQEGTSISAMLTAQLQQLVRQRTSYERARKRAVARLRQGMNLHWTPPRSRDEWHER
jgi:predicted transcriptional regulator